MKWDGDALRAGAMVALVFAVPLSIGARLAADNDHPGVATILVIGALIGFVIGAGSAAWAQRTNTPLSHGIVTAASTYLVAQAVFVVVRVVRGDDVRWFSIVFNLMAVVGAGLIGGLLGQRLRASGITPRSVRRPDGDRR
ncbi:hypothetical protein BH24ACT5_BH24ACT5_02000 [soil metagenome]